MAASAGDAALKDERQAVQQENEAPMPPVSSDWCRCGNHDIDNARLKTYERMCCHEDGKSDAVHDWV